MSESIEQVLSGREKLKNLEAENKYVFHGSENPDINEMEPRQGYNHDDDGTKKEDGEPAVFASDRVDYAIFMSLINKKNCPKGYKSSVESIRNKDGEVQLKLKTTREAIDQLSEDSEGYVYVFDKSKFQQREQKTEFISTVPISHIDKVRVTSGDLPPGIEIIE